MLSWVEIDLSAIAHNTKALRGFINPRSKILTVVKSNAYGHGLLRVARKTLEAGADYLGVDKIGEGLKLRRNKIKAPILVMGPPDQERLEEAIDKELEITAYDESSARIIFQGARGVQKNAKVHLKVDTGMHRFGVLPQQAIEVVKRIKRLPKIDLVGVYSHFSDAENRDKSFTFKQLGAFQSVISGLAREGIVLPLAHIANSAAALGIPSSHLDMVRLGIVIYGLFPSPELRTFFDLRPALSLKTKIAQVKRIPGSEKVGYGGTFVTKRPTDIGVIPFGYADGLDRGVSNLGKVLVKGKRASILGRICMNSCMIDITDISGVKVGDEVVLIGQQENETITAGEWAGYLGTINYEIVSRIPENIPRVYV